MRNFWKGALVTYLVSALLVGIAMGRTIPALNGLGMAWAGLGWPITTGCLAANLACDGLPPESLAQYLFDFDEGDA